MEIVRAKADLQNWLTTNSDCWELLSDAHYKDVARRWSQDYLPMIRDNRQSISGHRAIATLQSRLPSDAILFRGVRITQLANLGGSGWPTAYRATGLRAIDRQLANSLELIVGATDFAWSCVFSHEAGSLAWEQFYERDMHD